jgi:hypothetical protein
MFSHNQQALNELLDLEHRSCTIRKVFDLNDSQDLLSSLEVLFFQYRSILRLIKDR